MEFGARDSSDQHCVYDAFNKHFHYYYLQLTLLFLLYSLSFPILYLYTLFIPDSCQSYLYYCYLYLFHLFYSYWLLICFILFWALILSLEVFPCLFSIIAYSPYMILSRSSKLVTVMSRINHSRSVLIHHLKV